MPKQTWVRFQLSFKDKNIRLFDRNHRIFAPTIPHMMRISTVLAGTALASMAATASRDKVAVGAGPVHGKEAVGHDHEAVLYNLYKPSLERLPPRRLPSPPTVRLEHPTGKISASRTPRSTISATSTPLTPRGQLSSFGSGLGSTGSWASGRFRDFFSLRSLPTLEAPTRCRPTTACMTSRSLPNLNLRPVGRPALPLPLPALSAALLPARVPGPRRLLQSRDRGVQEKPAEVHLLLRAGTGTPSPHQQHDQQHDQQHNHNHHRLTPPGLQRRPLAPHPPPPPPPGPLPCPIAPNPARAPASGLTLRLASPRARLRRGCPGR